MKAMERADKREGLLFVNKKQQKTLILCGPWVVGGGNSIHSLAEQKL
jgi:hypothetical protein